LCGYHFGIVDLTESGEQPGQSKQSLPQVPEDHANVVTTAAKHGEDGVTFSSLQGALKWSGKFGQRAKMYPTRMNGYENDEATEFFRQV
jgi:hypothetical protein